MKQQKRISKKERDLVSQAFSLLGKRAAGKLTPEERKAKARAAGIASGKARRGKAEKLR